MANSLISIIIPVYKVEKYLDRCLESVVNQTYKNLEIILVDDGSPDNCPTMCDEWAKKDSRIKVIHKENGGLSDARNAGMDISTGEYIGFVDSDDYIDTTMYKKLLEKANEENSDMVLCGMSIVDEEGKITKKIETNLEKCNCDNIATFYGYSQNWYQNGCLYTDGIMASVWRILYKKQFVKENRFDNGMYYEDVLYNLPIIRRKPKISIVNENLYFYFQRSGSIVRSYDEVKFNKRLDFTRVAIERMSPLVDEDTLCSYKFQLYFQFISEFARSNRKDLLEKFKKEKWIQAYNCKKNYKCKQKDTKLFKYKVANWLVYKKWFKLFFMLFKLR